MKTKFLLSLIAAFIFPFMMASCSGNKDPKDMTNQELIETYRKKTDKAIEELKKCKTMEELEKKEASINENLTPFTEELSSRDFNEKEEREMMELFMEIADEYLEISSKISKQ